MLFDCEEGAALTITDGTESVYVHKEIVSNYSEYYKTQFMNGWKTDPVLQVQNIKPYRFIMEYIYKRGKTMKYKFDQDELCELLEYTDRTLMLRGDVTLIEMIFVMVIGYLKEYIGLIEVDSEITVHIMSLISLDFKETIPKLDELRSNLVQAWLAKIDFFSDKLGIDHEYYGIIKPVLSSDQKLYLALRYANDNKGYDYINAIDTAKIKAYLETTPEEHILDEINKLYTPKEISLILQYNKPSFSTYMDMIQQNGSQVPKYTNYPLRMKIIIGKIKEVCIADAVTKILVGNVKYTDLKISDRVNIPITGTANAVTFTISRVKEISSVHWNTTNKKFVESNVKIIYKNLCAMITFDGVINNVICNSDLWLDYI